MANNYSNHPRSRVTFPIIPDDAVLVSDNRVIMTNQQLITRNPNSELERFVSSGRGEVTSRYTVSSNQRERSETFDSRRQMPETEGKRPLGKKVRSPLVEQPKKKSAIDEAKKRAHENVTTPKPIKKYVSPLERVASEDLGVKALANKKLLKTQHSLGKTVSEFDKVVAQENKKSLFDAPNQDYFASKHSVRDTFDIVD
jgi:hypothetical protein